MDFSGHVDIKSLLRYRHPRIDQTVARLRALEQSRKSVHAIGREVVSTPPPSSGSALRRSLTATQP